MLLVYYNDILSISNEPIEAISSIKSVFKLKGDNAVVLEMYLGGGISKVEYSNRTKYEMMSSEKYLKAAVTNIEEKLVKSGLRLPSKCNIPFSSDFYLSTDTTPELDNNMLLFYQK